MTEEYTYKVGDRGFLKNGIDTYRILAVDAVFRPIGGIDCPIYALVISNSGANEEVKKIYEKSNEYSIEGWSAFHIVGGEGGADTYDLAPPS